jgi:hypothetical protein
MTVDKQTLDSKSIQATLLAIAKATLEGSETQGDWFTSALVTLEATDAPTTSQSITSAGSTAAAHAAHLVFTLNALTAQIKGQTPELDWSQSWETSIVSTMQLLELRNRLRTSGEDLLEAITSRATWEADVLEAVLLQFVHVAYHAGAIRQLVKAGQAVNH